MSATPASKIGVVAIGRNEGDRLRRCLQSVRRFAGRTVYVDSGSSDGSVRMAREMGAEVVELGLQIPFTAARARNEGFRRLVAMNPNLEHVQFVDGDCEIVAHWIERAAAWLDQHPDAAVACGRRRERHPERSIYNLLCDIEWDSPVGEAKECGGDALMRVAAFRSVKGFRDDLIAGEEPDLCIRLRAAGWRIWRLDEEMTLHDAAITRFRQWWKRSLRSGYAAAQGIYLHGTTLQPERVRVCRSIWTWGLVLPLAATAGFVTWGPWALAMLAAYPLQVARVAARGARTARENWWYAGFLLLGKFPELLGQAKFLAWRYTGGQSRLIEYK